MGTDGDRLARRVQAVAPRPTLTPEQSQSAIREGMYARENAERLREHPDDINAFVQLCLRDQYNRRWRQQSFHREWHAMADEIGPGGRLLIGAPREHAKTTQMSVGRTLHMLGRNPNLRIKIVCANDSLARSVLREIRVNIERNQDLRDAYPRLLPDEDAGWAKESLFVKRRTMAKDPSVEAAGVLSTGTGGRADLIIFDDVVDLRNAIQQPALRDQVKRAVYEVWLNLLTPDGMAYYVATVWHEADLTAELAGIGQYPANPVWQKWWRPALNEETGEVLWPGRWSKLALERKKLEIGPRPFARQYQLVPLSEDESVFPERILAVARAKGAQWGPGQIEAPADWPRYIGVDLASAMGRKAAYTVAFVIAVGPDGVRYPLEIVRQRLSFDQTVEVIARLWVQHSPMEVRVENNAYQDALLQHLRAQYPSMPLQGHTTGKQKADEQIGLPGLATGMANGAWVIPSGSPHPADCTCPWCAWEAELRSYPVAEFSDTVMAMWFADSAAGTRGMHPADSFRAYFAEDY